MRLIRSSSFVAALALSIVAAACGGGGGGTDANPVGPPTTVSALSGSSATVTAGSTAPIALVAKVLDAGGHAVPGATVTWGASSGSISPATATTDGSGQSTAQWALGKVAGSQSATASVGGAGAATFTATVTAGPLAKIKLTPDTTKLGAAGATAQMSAVGLDAFDNSLSGLNPIYTIDDPAVATVSGTGLLTAVKTGTTTVRATSGSIAASATVIVNTSVIDPCTGATLNLAVGGSQTLTGTAANQFCVSGATGAEFVAIPFYATGDGSLSAAPLPLTFTPLTNSTASGPPTPDILSSVRLSRAAVVAASDNTLNRDVAWELRFRERVRRQLGPMMPAARKELMRMRTSGARYSLGVSNTVVGDKISLNTNATQTCSNPQIHQATVRAVSTHAIVVTDDQTPTGGIFNGSEYTTFANTFDNQVWPTDTQNFGPESDVDKNGHVILFFTPAVNALTPTENTTSFVGGFFFGRDLYPTTTSCGRDANGNPLTAVGSNFAEMFYLLSPDPNGEINSHKRPLSFIQSTTMGTIAHEFQHLINFSSHLITNPVLFSAANFPEQTFLDEGLAHIAEELNYYSVTGRNPRENIDANTIVNPIDAFTQYADQNARRFREYLKNPDKYSPYSVLADTSLSVRGGIWSLLRYSADQRGTAEKSTWFQLVNPTTDVSGVANLKAVFGSTFLTTTMRNWTAANYMDDAGVANTAAAFTHPSWNTRSVETFENGSGGNPGTTFPLKTSPLITSPVIINLADGGAAYLRFAVNAGKIGGATVTGQSALPSTFSIIVIRTR